MIKNLQTHLHESLLDMNLGDSVAADIKLEYIRDHFYNVKATALKSGNIKITGDLILKDFTEDEIIGLNIVSVTGSVFIEDCPELLNIVDMFAPDCKVTGDFCVTNCKKFSSLEGMPQSIGGDVKLTTLPALRDLKGLPSDISSISLMKLAKRWKEPQVRKFVQPTTMITCSLDDEPAI